MAHIRVRQVHELFNKLVAYSSILGIFGHRQVGKSTFTAGIAKKYWTLDDRETLKLIKENPRQFLKDQKNRFTVIDECQNAPDLFPALKEHVRTDKRPGQFILTGSVRFTSRRAIRESLAGRMVSLELFPMVLSELREVSLPESIPALLKCESFTDTLHSLLPSPREISANKKSLDKYLLQGGLPGLCFLREERLRREALSSILGLILDRDLRMIVSTRSSIETLRRWLAWIAQKGWSPYNAAEVKREFGFSHVTQKSLLLAFESIFLIRRIPLRGRAGDIFLMEDQYEEFFLSEGQHSRSDQILSAFYRNVRAQLHYRLGDSSTFESYWTRSDARVPLLIRGEGKKVLGFTVIMDSQPTLSQKRSAESFLRHEPTGKMIFLTDHPGKIQILDPRILICPVAGLL